MKFSWNKGEYFVKNRIYTLSAIIILIVSIFIYCKNESSAQSNSEGMFIIKSYGALKTRGNGGCIGSASTSDDLAANDIINNCHIGYRGKVDKKYNLPNVSVTILKYKDEENVKNDIILEILAKKHLGRKKDYVDNVRKEIISNCPDKSTKNCFIRWASENYIITISSGHTQIPEELKQDYLSKYPPTEKFMPSDFDEKKIMKKQIKKHIKGIWDLEKDRNWKNRYFYEVREYSLMSVQCKHEKDIRCLLGMTNADGKAGCPTALTLDKSDREEEWKKLEEEAKKRKIIVKNINWDRPYLSRCQHENPDIEQTMKDMLGVDEVSVP
jgi:hypothetical protein